MLVIKKQMVHDVHGNNLQFPTNYRHVSSKIGKKNQASKDYLSLLVIYS